jgi:hypothetical protein
MDRKVFFPRKGLVWVLAMLTVGILFTACVKNKDDNMQTPVAGLMAFNLAPDQPSVFVTLGGNSLTQYPLVFTGYTGAYQSIYTGNRSVDTYNSPQNSLIASTSYNFEQNKYYSAFLVGYNNSYRNIVSLDNFDSLSTAQGSAYVRYINAITDSVNKPAVTISSGGNNVVNDNAAFGAVSDFKAITPGDISIAIKNTVNAIDTSRIINVVQNKVYTILLTGIPTSTNDSTRVKIRFIENGTLTGSQN